MMKLNYFNFKRLGGKVLLTNDFGDYLFLTEQDFRQMIEKRDSLSPSLANSLLNARMIYDESDIEFSALNHFDLREIKGFMAQATTLHIFVVTTACNLNCVYCQANNGTECPNQFMDIETAERAVDIALQSPTPNLSFEFQGGEPLLNFEVVRHIVLYAEEHKGQHQISYSVVSNLTLLDDDMLEFFAAYHVGISTSLDGDQFVHDSNRPYRNGNGSFNTVKDTVGKIQGRNLSVGAIETTTRCSLGYAREIVEGYRLMNFNSIFVRPLTPLGKASLSWKDIGYTPEEFLQFYREILREVIKQNLSGYQMQEAHATILLKRMHGYNLNYMELRSPCGGGIGQLAYFADGRIFTCDEGRMLAEMGDDAFLLGDVFHSDYQSLMKHGACRTVCAASVLESLPSCCDCVYQPYCGTCPVLNYSAQKDVVEREPHTYRCKIYSGMLDILFEYLLKNEDSIVGIFEQWSNS